MMTRPTPGVSSAVGCQGLATPARSGPHGPGPGCLGDAHRWDQDAGPVRWIVGRHPDDGGVSPGRGVGPGAGGEQSAQVLVRQHRRFRIAWCRRSDACRGVPLGLPSASSRGRSAGPRRTILEAWCSASHPIRLRTAFCYALMVLSASRRPQRQLPREGGTWEVGMTLGPSSAVLTREDPGHKRPSSDNYRDMDQSQNTLRSPSNVLILM